MSIQSSTDWTKLYADAKLKAWKIPAVAAMQVEEGTFRHLYLKWSDLRNKIQAGAPSDLLFICTDVLALDSNAEFSNGVFVFARRIEISNDAHITLNRTNGAYPFFLAAQEITDAQTGSPVPLKITVGDLQWASDPSSDPATIIRCASNATTPAAMTADSIDPGYLEEGTPLRIHLRTLFQTAILLTSTNPDISLKQLQWIVLLSAAGRNTGPMRGEAMAFASSLNATQAAKGQNNAIAVPRLDYTIYVDKARELTKLLSDRQNWWNALQLKADNDEHWRAAAADLAALQGTQDTLNQNLLQKAQQKMEQAEAASRIVTNQLVLLNLDIFEKEKLFEAGIEEWKLKNIFSTIKDMLSALIEILSQIPVMVVTGPVMGTQVVIQAATSAAKLEMTILEAALNQRPSEYAALAGKIAALGSTVYYKYYFKDLPLDKDRLLGLFKDIYDKKNLPAAPPAAPPAVPPVIPGVAPNIPAADVQAFEDKVNAIMQSLGGTNDPAAMLDKIAANKRKEAEAKMSEAIGKVGDGAEALVNSAVKIANIVKKAEAFHVAAKDTLKNANDSLNVAFKSYNLEGLDVLTGGAQEWDDLQDKLDYIFDNRIGVEGPNIKGFAVYRLTLKKLVALGKSYSQTKLAVAKSTADLAEMQFRVNASSQAVKIYENRLATLNSKIAQDETLNQLAFDKILDAKRSVYLALESYRRALIYYTLIAEDQAFKLPGFSDSTDSFSLTAANLTANSLESLPEGIVISNFEEKVSVTDDATLNNFRDIGTLFYKIDPTHASFRDYGRVRFTEVKVFVEGLKYDGQVEVLLRTSGLYIDKAYKPAGAARWFVGPRLEMNFMYVGSTREIKGRANMASQHLDKFFVPTPFTEWEIAVKARDGRTMLDFSTVTEVRFEFIGEKMAISEPD